jgi:uncharacterized protein YgiB involved in biofilm formation
MKRSRAVALFSMGASVLALTACRDTSALAPAKVYASIEECVAEGTFDSSQCQKAMFSAEDAYEAAYPKFETEAQCEDVAGEGHCEPDRPSSREYSYRPSMVAFMMPFGASSVQPQAVLRSASAPSGFSTATGASIARTGTTATVAASAAARPQASQVMKATTASRGGFGSSSVAHASTSSVSRGGG